MQEVDVIIPVYKPKADFVKLIEKLEHQTVPIRRILLFNTEQKYWNAFEYETPRRKRYENLRVYHISKESLIMGEREGKR